MVDAPAPAIEVPRRRLSRRRRQQVVRGLQYGIFAAVVLAVVLVADWPRLGQAFFNAAEARPMFPVVWRTFLNTLIYTALAFVFGAVLGLVLALMRLSQVRPYRWLATGYIELFRGLPALLVLFMVGFGIPTAFPNREFPGGTYGKVMIGLGLVAAAYMAETFRAGIQAVPKGQLEAARSLGMSYGRAMVSIVLPQAVRIVIPPLTNEIILLTKDSSLVYVLGITLSGGLEERELTRLGRDFLNSETNATPLVVVGLLYLAITLPLSQVVRWLELRAAKGR